MPGTIFQHPANSFSSTLSAQHTSGGTLGLQAGDGAKLGALGVNEVYRVTLLTNPGPTETILAILECTGITTDTLNGTVTAVDGTTDATFAIGTTVQVRATAKTFTAIHTAINNLEVVQEVAITGATTLANSVASFGKTYVCSGSSPYALTLPDLTAGTFDGLGIAIRMSPALTDLVTVTAQGTQKIDKVATRIMYTSQDATNPGSETAFLVARSGAWYKAGGKTIPMTCSMRLTANQTTTNTGLAATVGVTQVDFDTSGKMATVGSNGMTVVRPGAYEYASLILFNNLATAGRCIGIPSKNSTTTGFDQYETPGIVGGYPSVQGTAPINAVVGDLFRILTLNVTSGSQVLVGATSNQACNFRMKEYLPW